MTQRTHEKGASMVEVLGVLAVIATIATGMFTGIGHVHKKIKLTAAVSEVKDIVKAMQAQFAAFSPEDITSKKLYELGIFKNYSEEDGKTVNVFGSEMTVSFDDIDSERTFKVVYSKIPPNACVDLLLADWGNDPSSGLQSITVSSENGGEHKFQWKKDIDVACDTDTGTTYCLTPTLKYAVKACAHKDSSIDITWQYYI